MPKQSQEICVRRVTLERTQCPAECPVYTVEVDGAGHVVWNGQRFVKEIGRREWQLTDAQMTALCRLIRESKYFKYKDAYDRFDVDLSTACITSITLADGRSKRILHHYADRKAPCSLTAFEDALGLALGTDPYIGTYEERVPGWMELHGIAKCEDK